MTKTIPDYLRIHRETEGRPSCDQMCGDAGDAMHQFWSAFSQVTGWRVDPRASRDSMVELLPAVSAQTFEQMDPEAATVVGKNAAVRLAESALQLADELNESREAMRRQEAELATRAAILKSESDRVRLADQIEQTLASAAAASGCDAAAFYALDDDTSYLKARFVFGLPPDRLQRPPRPLRGSRGDLEAMVQGVVAIEDAGADPIDLWNVPEPFSAGICAAVKCDDVPIGTLWLFRRKCAPWDVRATAAARLAAGQLSLQLAHASVDRSPPARDSAIHDVAQWQFESLPVGSDLAQQWRADGMIESPRSWATGWHTWDVLPDGTIMVAIAEAIDRTAKGVMHAAVARAALASHTGYRHTPAQLMQRISDTLWQTCSGEQLVSILYARIDPESGTGEVTSAGSIAALVGSRRGYRPVVEGHGDPLNTQIDASFVSDTFRLAPGETFLAYTDGMVRDGVSQRKLGQQIQIAMESGDQNPLAAIRRSMATLPLQCERGAMTLLRLGPA